MRWSILLAVITALMATSAQAESNLQTRVGPLSHSTGDALLARSLVVLVVDLGRDGFEHSTQASFAPGTDDLVVGTARTILLAEKAFLFDYFVDNTINIGTNGMNASTIDSGDPFAMFWYPELTEEQFLTDTYDVDSWDLPAGPGSTSCGNYNTDKADPDWVFPSNSATISVNLLSNTLGGTIPASELANVFQASSFTTGSPVPEPSSTLLLLAASTIFVLRRRRS